MSSVRVLVGTKKGAFILTGDGKRQKWKVDGPHFGVAWCVGAPPALPADMHDIQLLPIDAPAEDVAPGECVLVEAGQAKNLTSGGTFVLAWSTQPRSS